MALVIEDGTGLSTADSYASETDASTYLSGLYGAADAFVVAAAADQERHMRLAAQQLDSDYEALFGGIRANQGQAMAFPRSSLYDSDGRPVSKTVVPVEVKKAQYEYARRIAAGTTIRPDLERGGAVKRQRVDALEIEYFQRATAGTTYPQVERLLQRYLSSSRGEVRFARA